MRHGRHAAIGVFDSGVGGLTVLKALMERLPLESTVYLGDTARVPYGTKSGEVVTRYSLANAHALLEYDIKALVVACNTASAVALPALEKELPIPVIGVIVPGANAAAEATKTGRVAVIGTPGTIASGAYQAALAQASASRARVRSSCRSRKRDGLTARCRRSSRRSTWAVTFSETSTRWCWAARTIRCSPK